MKLHSLYALRRATCCPVKRLRIDRLIDRRIRFVASRERGA